MTTDPNLIRAGRHLALAQRQLGPEVHGGGPGVRACFDELNHAAVALASAGVAVTPDGSPHRDPMSLTTLSKIESSRPEGIALLEALGQLLPTAEKLDKARGDWVGDMAATHLGETPGTNYAEAVQELYFKLKLEIGGVKGSGLE